MNVRYLSLAAGVVLLALALTVLGRPRPVEHHASAPAAHPEATLGLVIENGRLTPATSVVAQGTRVRLSIAVRGTRGARLELAGYQDRLTIPDHAAGATWSGEFVADRPGDDLAWLVDGAPAGRLAVTGSHLIEGHR